MLKSRLAGLAVPEALASAVPHAVVQDPPITSNTSQVLTPTLELDLFPATASHFMSTRTQIHCPGFCCFGKVISNSGRAPNHPPGPENYHGGYTISWADEEGSAQQQTAEERLKSDLPTPGPVCWDKGVVTPQGARHRERCLANHSKRGPQRSQAEQLPSLEGKLYLRAGLALHWQGRDPLRHSH